MRFSSQQSVNLNQLKGKQAAAVVDAAVLRKGMQVPSFFARSPIKISV